MGYHDNKMKESNYNFFISTDMDNTDSLILAYNSYTSALAIMNSDNYTEFVAGREDGFSNLDIEFKEQLEHGKFIIENDCNELLELRHSLLISRYQSDSLSLTIAPTLGCNFDCIYCFEKDHSDYTKISDQLQEKIVEYVKQSIINGIKTFSVTWYGGEPLLAVDVIESLTRKLYNLCKEENVQYSATIVTNGYLLSRETVCKLVECHINSIQVTLDGPKNIHDSRRFLRGGYPTFDKIVSNLEESIDIIPNVSLRINVDKDNFGSVYELKEYFNQEIFKEKVSVYIAMVDALNDNYDQKDCLSIEKFANMDIHFYENPMAIYPHPVRNACGADNIGHIVITPDGNLYKCWNDVGIVEMSIGNLYDTKYRYHSRYYEYMMYDATSDPKCENCKLLPICMGGCPNRRIQNSPARCTKFKVALDEYLKEVAKYLISHKKDESSVSV